MSSLTRTSFPVSARPALAGLAFALSVGANANGVQAQTSSRIQNANAVHPPELLEAIDPVYPDQALAERLQPAVGLRLTIDTEGHVTDAELVEPAGHGFDEAAQKAALGFRFRPARRGELLVSARILYRVQFRLPEPEPTPVAAPPAPSTPELGLADAVTKAPSPAAALPTPAAAAPVQPPGARSTAGPQLTAPVEITVSGVTAADKLRHSAEAVTVVDTQKAQEQSADLGEVLARTQGVAVRRDAGLGSNVRFSLNGLDGDQIRFFIDGVPLEFAGFPAGVANVPVNLVDRIEVYRGVVPIRFGADALGGALNLISSDSAASRASASYQVGAFGTHRATLAGKYRDESTGLFASASAFLDVAKNDYDVDVEVPDVQGRLHDATVPRFHDAYDAHGAFVEGGVVDRPWAERLSARVGYTAYDKQLQSNTVMTVPYGEVHYGERGISANARYEQDLSKPFRLELLAAYAHRVLTFEDEGKWVYDWYGNRILQRRVPGEIDGQTYADIFWENDVYARGLLAWRLHRGSTVRLSSALKYSERTGQDRTLTDSSLLDPLSAQRTRLTVVSGLEWELDAWQQRIQNIAFGKEYFFHSAFEDALPGGRFVPLSNDSNTFGGGDAFRVRPVRWLYLKASYEYATRLPSTDELFGNGVLISSSPKLEAEVSHNLNMGPRVELRSTPLGDFTADVNAFLRDSDRLIVLLGSEQFLSYQNVYHARSRGVEGELGWATPGRFLTFDGASTYQDQRNVSNQGTFGGFEGDRIPNRPWLFASFGMHGRIAHLPEKSAGVLEPFYVGRYVHSFLRGWESVGLAQYKQGIPSQLSHDLGVSYLFRVARTRLRSTVEVENLGNAKLYDSFGAQRPGRSLYLKVTADIQ